MAPCSHFQIWCKRIPRRALSREGREAHHEIKVPYCTHPQSPAPLETAQHGLGEGVVLGCGGHARRCPLPEDMRPQGEPRRRLLSERAVSNLEDPQLAAAGGSGRE